MSSPEDSLRRAEDLLAKLERSREELERAADGDDPEVAIEVLNELAALAKEVEAELARAKRKAEAESQ